MRVAGQSNLLPRSQRLGAGTGREEGDSAMDPTHFDELTRSLTDGSSRRRLLQGLAGGALAAVAAALGVADAAATHWGCLHVGKPCRRDRQCCSGRCRGPKGNETCRAHHEGTCAAAKDTCITGTFDGCGGGACVCFRTTGGANFCGGEGPCHACTTDRDCESVTGPGSACVDVNHGICTGCGSTTRCVPPCV